jgi:hypothetical protein
MHATILHLFGLDHKRLTYRFQGHDFRLTDVSGNVVKHYWQVTHPPQVATVARRSYRGGRARNCSLTTVATCNS